MTPGVVELRGLLVTALVGQRNGTPVFDSATGMTIYFPNEPRDFDSDFEALATAGPWMPFLEAFYNDQAGVVLQTDVGFAAETLTVAPDVDEPGWYQISVPVTANFVGSVQLVAATTEHVVPRVKGGPSWAENELAACRRCNGARGHLGPVDWLEECRRRGWSPDADRLVAAHGQQD